MVESSYNTDYYGEEDNKNPSFINKIKLASGGLSLVVSIIILLSLVSYLFTGFDDQSLINSGLNLDSFKSHLQTFKWGMPPHAGLGLGFDRLMMVLANKNNIREVVLYPRDQDRLDP